MDFGLLLVFRNPRQWLRSFPEIYQEHLEQAVYAEALGYDTIWTTEHHFAEDGWSPSLLPFHLPVRVAEDAATMRDSKATG